MHFSDSYFENEVRDGFFVPSMMKRAWAAQMEVLGEVDRICRKHQITYFADYGTLLGAVRHRGFIPWDDDLDISMLRADYDRFLAVAVQELPEGYFLRNIHTDDSYTELFSRLLNSRQIDFSPEFLERFHGCPYGMGIDIYVMDYIPASPDEEAAWLGTIRSAIQRGRNADGSMPNRVYLEVEQLCSAYAGEESEELTVVQVLLQSKDFRWPKSYYQKSIRIPFETATIPVPLDYDGVLHRKYQEYMRTVKHGGAHDYPLYRKQEEELQRIAGSVPYKYVFSREELNPGAGDGKAAGSGAMPAKASAGEAANREAGTAKASAGEAADREAGTAKVSAKSLIREWLALMGKLHQGLREGENNDTPRILDALVQCQEAAIGLGTLVDKALGEGTEIVRKLEEYCEMVYQMHEEAAQAEPIRTESTQKALPQAEPMRTESTQKALPQAESIWTESIQTDSVLMEPMQADSESCFLRLEQCAEQIKACIQEKIDIRYEAWFLPYQASKWGYLESVWRAAEQDPDCAAYVIPIPYYYKKSDGNLGAMQYEAEYFPKDVPITKYDEFDYGGHCPDAIYIQNPYDEYDSAVSVHPFFYSKSLKRFTGKLIYIPDFVVDEVEPDDQRAIENLRCCCETPGMFYADKVIVQSEGMRQIYIDILTRFAGEETRGIWEGKILGLGSPKADQDAAFQSEDAELSEEWMRVIRKPDGSRKKIVLYVTSVSTLHEYGGKMLDKMRRVFAVFREKREEIALVWLPDGMAQPGMEAEHPEIWREYRELADWYQREDIGIYATPENAGTAVAACDAYYGDGGAAAELCLRKSVPVMLQDVEV